MPDASASSSLLLHGGIWPPFLGAGSQQFLPWLFPRLLGGIYLLAFLSLLAQVRGLFGAAGVLPIADYLAELRRGFGKAPFLSCPTLFWFANSDRALFAGCLLGVALSLILIAGVAPAPTLFLLWLLYLSFVAAGQEFLAFQWDTLLLEVGFMTIFLPLAAPAPPLVVFTYRFLFIRFMLSAGAVKLLSKDTTWRDLTAMCYHYQTQPIPNRPAWYAHQLPKAVQKFSAQGTFFFELVVPLLAFGPSLARQSCFVLSVFFQALIFATGNFGFFNLLTAVIAFSLLDDGLLAPHLQLPQTTTGEPMAILVSAIFAAILALNLCQCLAFVYRPHWLNRLLARLSPFMISNHYGLFAVMTTERFEFVIEGSNDGEHWQEYEFRWKPGDPMRPPRQAAPHQPRLDWQMWFAALEPGRMQPWVASLVVRLLQGSPAVTRLLKGNPFPDSPPRLIRVSVYDYRFSNRAEKRSQGVWWERTLIGRFKPIALRKEASRAQ